MFLVSSRNGLDRGEFLLILHIERARSKARAQRPLNALAHDVAPADSAASLKCTLRSLGVDALVSIGGDDTLKTANKFMLFQNYLPAGSRAIPIVHLPKTIDNDYKGIDFTFGYFTAVHTLADEIRNLLADAEVTSSYFVAETMGRSAGWLAYGAAIAGEASLVLSVEDIRDGYETTKTCEDENGEMQTRSEMNVEAIIDRIVKLMIRREQDGKQFGVIVLAEGLAERLPYQFIEGVPRDAHGHLAVSSINMHELFAGLIEEEYYQRTARHRKV